MNQSFFRDLPDNPGEIGTNQKGATMVEYAIMVALVTLVVIASVRILGTNVSTHFSTAAMQFN
jgi:Flp pilus assembly pilin Flp